MAKTAATKYAILGLLSSRPASGYEMKKFIDRSIRYFWTENYGNIYPALAKMEREGLVVKKRAAARGRPDKFIFNITKNGERQLDDWLRKPCAPQPVRSEMLLKLFLSKRLDPPQVRGLVEAHRARQTALLEQYAAVERHIEAEKNADSLYWRLTLDYGRRNARMAKDWCEATLSVLADRAGEKI
jgi:DNA-binding PadR family transcriptional regulator